MLQWIWEWKYLLEILFLIHLDKSPEEGLQTLRVALFLIFHLHTIFNSGYTILHPHQHSTSFPISPHFNKHLLFFCFVLFCSVLFICFIMATLTGMKWLSWLVMLTIFSYAGWPFVCLFKRDVCSSPLPSSKLDCLKGLGVTESFIYFGLVPYILTLHQI